uniref:Uncharacterized protein n=1 Tax=Anguilla anguilla TaxID=7936 RepID=A0A0E9S7K7_ANGAN
MLVNVMLVLIWLCNTCCICMVRSTNSVMHS